MFTQYEMSDYFKWGCIVSVCIVFLLLITSAVSNWLVLREHKHCNRVEGDLDIIYAALYVYYRDHPERTDVPSLETLKKEQNFSIYGVGYIFGSSPEDITAITSSESKRCNRGKYYVAKFMSRGTWVDEWPTNIPNPNLVEDNHNSFFSWIKRVFN